MDSIFGYQLGETFFKGLVDADDAQDFKAKLEELKPKWHATCPAFHQWYATNEAELCSSMICSVRSSAGLGFPPRAYATNNNESINRVLKEKVSEAVCGWGEYELCDDYKHLEVPYTEWVRMTPEQRKVYTTWSSVHEKSSNTTAKLSVGWSCAHITHLQPIRVAELGRKAESIEYSEHGCSSSWKYLCSTGC